MISNRKNSQSQSTAIVWLRRDLRIADNPALDYALRHRQRVIPVYVHSQSAAQAWPAGSASNWWCHHSLQQLAQTLRQLGMRLHLFRGDPVSLLAPILQQTGASLVCWNKLYEPFELGQSDQLRSAMSKQCPAVELAEFDSATFFAPGSLLNKQGQPYRVFSPFWRAARQRLEQTGVRPLPGKFATSARNDPPHLDRECELDELGLLDAHPWHRKLHEYWQPGEAMAHQRLHRFVHSQATHYANERDIPSLEATSRLSAHLHFGEITPAQIFAYLQRKGCFEATHSGAERFLTELGWREFAVHVMWHFPHTTEHAMNPRFEKFWPSRVNQKRLHAWQRGRTGIPLIDAAMRELWQTGWMHNRMRMIVGSFLTKNLGIHWLHGARWFWDTLVDADLANNTLGWQWVAGCGVDAAPYYRIFNPITQQQRFDPQSRYIRRWLHDPRYTPAKPIVDLKQSREDALLRYRKLTNRHATQINSA